jgi:hypothetical protein
MARNVESLLESPEQQMNAVNERSPELRSTGDDRIDMERIPITG